MLDDGVGHVGGDVDLQGGGDRRVDETADDGGRLLLDEAAVSVQVTQLLG